MAEAVALGSIDLSDVASDDRDTLAHRIRTAAADGPVRATGLDDGAAPLLDVHDLDAIASDVPVRVQYRTGALWVLNSADLSEVVAGMATVPPDFERTGQGHLTGRVWRGDHWLRRPRASLPSLERIGCALARWGVTAVTDASVTTDQRQAEAIAQAAMDALPQRLTLMSGGALAARSGWNVGPVKILLDDAALPSLDTVVATIEDARVAGRAVAAHCVTASELALMLAAWSVAGVCAGDRIEHGSSIPEAALEVIAALGITVVVNPGFVEARGDRYLARSTPDELHDLCRLRSLLDADIRVAAGSDAPYGPLDPWRGVAAAVSRRTASGQLLGLPEALTFDQAVRLYLRDPQEAGRSVRLDDGSAADVVLLRPEAETEPYQDPVAMTLIGGKTVYRRAVAFQQERGEND